MVLWSSKVCNLLHYLTTNLVIHLDWGNMYVNLDYIVLIIIDNHPWAPWLNLPLLLKYLLKITYWLYQIVKFMEEVSLKFINKVCGGLSKYDTNFPIDFINSMWNALYYTFSFVSWIYVLCTLCMSCSWALKCLLVTTICYLYSQKSLCLYQWTSFAWKVIRFVILFYE